MLKQFMTYAVIVMAMMMCSNIASAEKMDRDWCITLLEIKDTVDVPDSVAEPITIQCAIFQKEAQEAIKAICKIDDTEARKVAAEEFNHQNKDDYNIYIQMVRALCEFMERKCLGPAAAIMSYDVVKTNSEIDAMFTIFRSRRPLPDNDYTRKE